MKTIVQLSEKDIREALAEKYNCEEDDICIKASKVPSFLSDAFGMNDNYIITAEFVKKEEKEENKDEQT